MNHRLYIDLQATQRLAHAERGIARYSIELTSALLRAGAPIDTLATSPHLPDLGALPADIATSPLLCTRTSRSLAAAAARGPFAYLLMSPMESELSAHRTVSESAIERASVMSTIVYDFIPLMFPDRYLPVPGELEVYKARLKLLRQFDLFVAISEHTRLDTIEHLGVDPDRVVTIGGGVSPWFSPPDSSDEPAHTLRGVLPSVDRPFVLTIGAWEWRKNVETLIDAFARLEPSVRDGLRLVVACGVPPHGEAAWRSHAAAAGLADDQIVVTGYVDDVTLRDLYRAATLFVFPSRYEGFGLPVAEAARCGAPVVTSRTSSLPEILRLPASTFDPDDADEMAAVMYRGLTDTAFRAELRDAGARGVATATWDAVAERLCEAHRLLGDDARGSSRARPRVALTLPHVDITAPATQLVVRLAGELEDRGISTHVFVESPASITGRLAVRGTSFPIEALERHLDPFDYDLFVHASVDSPGQPAHTVDLAGSHAGLVWTPEPSEVGPVTMAILGHLASGAHAGDDQHPQAQG